MELTVAQSMASLRLLAAEDIDVSKVNETSDCTDVANELRRHRY